jgi:predicted hotdog family 3-hydroxylacyl-ACP dehydratase
MPLEHEQLEHDEIEKLIPHAGAMVLLDRVIDWDPASIRCRTESHLRLDNPLRRGDMLPGVAGIEIAAQAMAIHARLTSGRTQRKGVLGSLRDVRLNIDRLDTCGTALLVYADLRGGDGRGRVYSFSVRAAEDAGLLLEGRASVFFL